VLVDLSVAYYNSKPQVKAMLTLVQGLISDVTARDWRDRYLNCPNSHGTAATASPEQSVIGSQQRSTGA
jgi:hypothetical protein